MNNFFISLVFMLFTLSLLVKIIGYGIYEIKNEDNLFGGICVIVFTVFSIVLSNIMVWIH